MDKLILVDLMAPPKSITLSLLVVIFTVMYALLAAASSSHVVVIPSLSAFAQSSSSAQQEETDSSSSSSAASSARDNTNTDIADTSADDNTQTDTNTQSFDVDQDQDVEAEVDQEAEQAAGNLALTERDGGGSDGSSPSFSLQATERSNTITTSEQGGIFTVSVQCNPDEVVTGGGFSAQITGTGFSTGQLLIESKKLDNGWSATWFVQAGGWDLTAYAECLKIVHGAGAAGE